MENKDKVPSHKIRLVLTNSCNMNCPWCVDAAVRTNTNGSFMTLTSVNKAIAFAKENNITEFTLTGGEPTLHPDIEEIVKLIKANGFRLKMITNYVLSDVVKRMDGEIDRITISYYGQELPEKNEFLKSQVVLSIILDADRFQKLEDLDYYIDKYSDDFEVTFRTMWSVNDYCHNRQISFLDELDKLESNVINRGRVCNYYRGHKISRIDLPKQDEEFGEPHYKMHVDGTIARDFADVYQDTKGIYILNLKRALRDQKSAKGRKLIWASFNSAAL